MTTVNLRVLQKPAQKATHTTVDTILIDPEQVKGWENPPFQRPLRVNDKVRELAAMIKADGGVIPGVITLGILDKKTFLLDGQHRREAFLLSECQEGAVDIRKHFFSSMSDMGEEFVNLNSQLVKLRPDDILRGLEGSLEPLAAIRKACPFVGYDMIRRNEKAPVLSMSVLLRSWNACAGEVPAPTGGSAMHIAKQLSMEEAEQCIDFLKCCDKAFGRDVAYQRLWGGLNLTLCGWLFRRMVITPYGPKTYRATREMFSKCLMSLSADSTYIDWLLARKLSDRDRSPAYARIRAAFVKRIEAETGVKPYMPAPNWAHHLSRRAPGMTPPSSNGVF